MPAARSIEVKSVELKKHYIERKQPSIPIWRLFIRVGPVFLIVLFAWAIAQDGSNSDVITPFMNKIGLSSYRKLVVEFFIGFICWSCTNLFIRRLGNPETFNGALDRFCADAYFGGMAAGLQSALKVVLHNKLSN